jgi:U1 small nuclear ribonucleoprotein C
MLGQNPGVNPPPPFAFPGGLSSALLHVCTHLIVSLGVPPPPFGMPGMPGMIPPPGGRGMPMPPFPGPGGMPMPPMPGMPGMPNLPFPPPGGLPPNFQFPPPLPGGFQPPPGFPPMPLPNQQSQGPPGGDRR